MASNIIKVRSDTEIAAVRVLVWEFFDAIRLRYPDMLDEIASYIEHQGVAKQLEDFADVFLPPNGDCFLAYRGAEPVGIVMLRRHGENDGEMNRMFVRDSARGLGLGRELGEALITEARALGFGKVWLDAIHRHVEALPLYDSLGFRRYTSADAFKADDPRIIHMVMDL